MNVALKLKREEKYGVRDRDSLQDFFFYKIPDILQVAIRKQ